MAKGKKTGGRKAGTPNKTTGTLKEMILSALDGVGGIEYLKAQASACPTAFLALIGKVLPLQVTGDKDNPLQVSIEHTAAREKVVSGIAGIAQRFGTDENPERAERSAIH